MTFFARAIKKSKALTRLASRRLKGRPDSEHEMSFNRLVFALIIIIILFAGQDLSAAGVAFASMGVYIALAVAVLCHIVIYPGVSRIRRICALLLDCVFLSWELHLGGARAAFFFPIYLWVIFGNGFRFGIPYLFAAVPVAIATFGAVIFTTPFWSAQLYLSIGLLVGLIILPGYASTLIKKLSQATKAAEAANNTKSLFLASVSHELRTPLTAIIGMNGLLKLSPLDDEQREMAETVDVASRSLESLINQILDLSRIDAGRMTNAPEDFDLLSLLVDLKRMMESQVRAKNISFDFHVTSRTPLRLRASRLHLQEILINLVGNAVKFTESGGVLVAVDGQAVGGSENDISLQIEVTDTGIGIAPEDQSRIFDSFTQANASILNRFGGTGLGLAITQRLIRLLGGDIAVESKVGSGSTFKFDIKAVKTPADADNTWRPNLIKVAFAAHKSAAQAEIHARVAAMGVEIVAASPSEKHDNYILAGSEGDPALQPGTATSHPAILIHQTEDSGLPGIADRRRSITRISNESSDQELQQALQIAIRLKGIDPQQAVDGANAIERSTPLPIASVRRRVLLVDDNRVNRRVFARILETAGHEVVLAENGSTALDVLEHEAERLDIVLMDFNMPEMDGIEATKLYRAMATGETRLPIVGLTADAFAQSNGLWRDADMDGCLIKPVTPHDLIAVVESKSRPRVAPASEPETAHPARSRPMAPSALDHLIIANLRQLGDVEFFDELMSDFLMDAKAIIDRLTLAATQGDSQEFRSDAHALRSAASNMGAAALCELCAPWVGFRSGELRSRAGEFATHAQLELTRTREAITALRSAHRIHDAQLGS